MAKHVWRRLGVAALLWAGLIIGMETQAVDGQPAKSSDGMFVSVPHPITKAAVEQIEAKVRAAIVRRNRAIGTVVFDFTPKNQPGATTDYHDCKRLVEYIQKLNLNQAGLPVRNITTVAFVHGEVSRHTVLPVLACSQIIMSEEAKIGAIPGENEVIKPEMRDTYQRLAEPKGVWNVVQKMLRGHRFSTEETRNLNLSAEVYETRKELSVALRLPPRSLREDWLAGRSVYPAKIELNGAANSGNLESFKRRVKRAIQEKHNFLILWLNSGGGQDIVNAANLQTYLRTRRDTTGKPMKIIAYVPPNVNLGAATYIALGADEIVMGSNSSLGDFSLLGHRDPQDARHLADMAKKSHYPPALFQATLDPDIVVFRVQANNNAAIVDFISKQDWDADQQAPNPKWSKNRSRLTKNNEDLLKITPEWARDAGIATFTGVDTFEDLCAKYNIDDPGSVTVSRGDWLDGIAEFFRLPIVKIVLLLVGIAGLILEIKMPGFGVPGIIAALSFVLFFWAHSFVNQYTTLAILLFLLGLVLLGLEIFVVPGFGVTGFSGLALLVVSIVLVMLEKMPESPNDWQELGWSVSYFCISLLGAIVVAVAVASFLPQIPYANRMMLMPPDESPDAEHFDTTASISEASAALLGAIGITETPLRPAGKARFGDDYVDVVSEGDYIAPGSRVQVVEIESTRIVVKQV